MAGTNRMHRWRAWTRQPGSHVARDAGVDGHFQVRGTSREELMGTYRGSLMAVDGAFLCLGEMGHLLWMDLTPKGYQESHGRGCSRPASRGLPVLSRGLLYVAQIVETWSGEPVRGCFVTI